ncbi:MAG: hypothetical protein A3H44_03235 [Gammaproteobacteria bacterium RIFCSPLOWO2_02_FULL_57_10]|nr:MAG: hypothetical protein A3H44_03235 [Gammaproteobacteria bacterium RIFCSPLOWO2_02_FULL_57_10]
MVMNTNRQISVDSAAKSHLDNNKLRNTLETDEPKVLLEFYSLYMEQLQELIGLLGRISLPEDVGSVVSLAHKMKSSSQSIGAFRVASRLSVVEELALKGDSERLRDSLAHIVQDCDKTLLELKLEVHALSVALMV